MEMTILERDGITHVALIGRLDTNAAEQIDKQFADAIRAHNRSAIVDLSEVAFMASRGIGLLVANGKWLMRAGQKLVLLNPRGMVADTLKIARADLFMPIVRDIDEAIHVLGGGQAKSGEKCTEFEAAHPVPQTVPQKSTSTTVAPPDVLKLSVKNEISELATANAAMKEYLAAREVPDRAAYAVDLAIEELVANVLEYAYVDDETHIIEVELCIEGNQIVLRIVDDGMPFDPRKGPSLNVHSEEREGRGLGLTLVLDMVDVLKYRRHEDRNCVEVRIHLTVDGEESDSANTAAT